MTNCPEHVVQYMHDYLDEDILPENKETLITHLQTCEDCKIHFNELRKTIALVQSMKNVQAPSDFTNRVIMNLPKEKKQVGAKRWFNKHPFLVAAAVFTILMGTSFLTAWNEDNQFSVTKNEFITIEDNNTAVVPEGHLIEGDIIVKNGNIRIEGEVEGNVTVINGEQYMAAAGNVTGEIEEINEVFEWLWYHIKKITKEVVNVFDFSSNPN